MKRLDRLLAIALYLGSRRLVLARDIADEFDVSLRTVYRDVRALVEAGFPIQGNPGDGYRLTQTAYLRPLALSPEEAQALMMAAHAFGAAARPTMRDALVRATAKLEAALDAPSRRRVAELDRRVVVPEFVKQTAGPTDDVLRAIHEGLAARIAYRSPRAKKRTTREVEPLGLVCVGHAWWLVAYCLLRKDARAFRVDCIESWRFTGRTFAPREGLSFAEIVARDQHLAKGLFGS